MTEEELKKALLAWGPGKYDAEILHDGKAFRPDGKTGCHSAAGRVRPGRE